MEMKYKIFALLALAFVAPGLAFGANVPLLGNGLGLRANKASGTIGVAKMGVNFCDNLTVKLERYGNNMQNRLGNYETRKGEQLKRVADNRAKADAKRTDNRTKADEVRSGYLKQLEERATTTAQKEALAEFKKSVEQLAITKREGVDKSVADYRASVDKSLADRQTAVVKAQADLKLAIDTALAKAKTDCSAGVDQATVRKETMASIKDAQDKFRDTVKSLDKVRNTLNKDVETRRGAIDTAQDSFRATYLKAWQTLKDAFSS